MKLKVISKGSVYWLSTVGLVVGIGVLAIPLLTQALTISPPLTELTIESGEQAVSSIRIFNDADESVVVRAEISGVAFDAAANTPLFETPDNDPMKLPAWIPALPAPFTLKSGAWVDVPITIEVPRDAVPGSYAAVVFFVAAPEATETGGVGILSRTGSVLLVTVPGELRTQGELVAFELADGDLIFPRAPRLFVLQVKNTGTVHFVPTGTVEIKNMIGGTVRRLAVNADGRRVLPDWTRTFEVGWGPDTPFAFGRYTATLSLMLGETGYAVTRSYWVLPPVIIIVAVLGIVALMVLWRKLGSRRSL